MKKLLLFLTLSVLISACGGGGGGAGAPVSGGGGGTVAEDTTRQLNGSLLDLSGVTDIDSINISLQPVSTDTHYLLMIGTSGLKFVNKTTKVIDATCFNITANPTLAEFNADKVKAVKSYVLNGSILSVFDERLSNGGPDYDTNIKRYQVSGTTCTYLSTDSSNTFNLFNQKRISYVYSDGTTFSVTSNTSGVIKLLDANNYTMNPSVFVATNPQIGFVQKSGANHIVSEPFESVVEKVDETGTNLATFGERGTNGCSSTRLESPGMMVQRNSGNILIIDEDYSGNGTCSRVVELDSNLNFVRDYDMSQYGIKSVSVIFKADNDKFVVIGQNTGLVNVISVILE